MAAAPASWPVIAPISIHSWFHFAQARYRGMLPSWGNL
ncbi:hypothetical protein SMB34_12175 [Thalassospira permensis NBRC 106175]|uniref:Uncharacterized protein n=1 Tax=Thalassospira permensis NBRC 106175 TaxID=1353532 RepID=A0ABR4TSE7_9PROT|nr:hypothetical protein SMB34_12175 [Thalassospira permensis NBRC 106175]